MSDEQEISDAQFDVLDKHDENMKMDDMIHDTYQYLLELINDDTKPIYNSDFFAYITEEQFYQFVKNLN